MSDRPERPAAGPRPDPADAAPSEPPAAPAPAGEPSPEAAGPDHRGLALALGAALLLVLALVGTAPLWAPLLPWGGGRAGADPALGGRLEAVQRQIQGLEQQIATTGAALPQLEQRIGALEQRPLPALPDLGDLQRQIAAATAGLPDLTERLVRLEGAARTGDAGLSELRAALERLDEARQAQAASLSDLVSRLDRMDRTQREQTAALSGLATRLDRAEQAGQAQAADLDARFGPLQQEWRAQQAAIAALEERLQNVEKAGQAHAGDLTDMALTLALLQIRNAIEAGRPFPAEYEALARLATARPEIAEAAAPLAGAAPTGIADRAALTRELRALAQRIDAAPAATRTDGGWTGAVLDRLHGLVRIRRADEAEPIKEAAATIRTAERALAGGDLARAVTAIETLHGPAAEAAGDWLHQARGRLAAEAALQRLEALLTARLGGTAAIPGAPG
jgi:hypothetical protein